MKPVAIKDDIYWVGAVDWQRRDFHGYTISPYGTTYNAFLVKDEKITLFDSGPKGFAGEILCRAAQVCDLADIEYIVANHGEMDHSGALPELVERIRPKKVFCSPMAAKSLAAHYDVSGWPLEAVDFKTPLCLGKRNVHFVETRMLHWPDSMVSYLAEDKLLISQDAFGQNIAGAERFSDETDEGLLRRQAARYYANIVLPYSPMTLKTIEAIEKAGLSIDMIAPDHGVIWRGGKDVAKAIAWYKEFALQKPTRKAVIVYDTMWKSTETMAQAVASGLDDEGVAVRIMALKVNHRSDVMEEVWNAGAVLVGSPTHNNGILPPVAAMLTYMKGLKPKNKIGAAFGSYGWSGESIKIVSEALTDMGFETVPGVKCQFVPKQEALAACVALGRTVGAALAAKLSA
ncbi:MAG: flavodoxin domain-containing protein [Desulfovibrionaceae bacterium]|nr:flavodoxin domain-containing protein [Desulfovibrionaceae bacterium]MBF0513810.1 flavodoxin domain-containing protein [Desulfovibrionaceae bacterium]